MEGNLIETEVTDLSPAGEGIRIVTLSAVTSRPLPRYSPGAHITLHLRDGDLVRRNSYTLIGPAEAAHQYRIAVQLQNAGRGGSRFIHERLAVGERVAVAHPLNLFSLHRLASRHIFVAGGIGITPFMTLIPEAIRQNKPFELHYAFRRKEAAAFATDLKERYAGRTRTYEGARGQRIDLIRLMEGQPAGTHIYVCGPSSLVDAASHIVAEGVWPRSRFHFERFKANFSGPAFSARLRSTGETISVGNEQSLLDCLEDAGHRLPYMCRTGFCGRCKMGVEATGGKIVHNDQVMDEEERNTGRCIIPCVSRFEGAELILEL
ncbi:MAG: ferredoxin--NADP(+) reductase [Shinella sp.]|nr:MAG: ferredoxin--NADP(+) reductase [Shinella sp.]